MNIHLVMVRMARCLSVIKSLLKLNTPSRSSKNHSVYLANLVDNNPYMAEAARQELAIHFSLKHKNIV